MTIRLGVLASGSGSNFQAILDAIADGRLDAEVRLLLCNRAGARVLERAAAAGVDHQVIQHRDFPDRPGFDAALVSALRAAEVQWVVLAGFMRVLTSTFLAAFPDRVVNVHPALLPSFPGAHGARDALAYGAHVSGCTVHLVDAGVDTGPILAQAAVPVLPTDDEDTLQARIQRQEHRLLPQVLQWLGEGRLVREDRRTSFTGLGADADAALLSPRLEA